MNELLFPLAAIGTTVFIVIPLLTLVSCIVLSFMRRRASSWGSFGSEMTFAWLVGPTLLPVFWLFSSAVHQSEPTKGPTFCIVDHVEATRCVDTVMLLGLLVFGSSMWVGSRAWRERPRMKLRRLENDHKLVQRIVRIVRNDAHLRDLRLVVVRESAEPIYTMGLIRPVVVVDACFIREADPQMLQAALLHEHAHINGFDTLRSFIVRLSLSCSPAGRLLSTEFQHWRNARESVCDSEAVHRGGDALALAEGLICATRFRCGGLVRRVAAFCGHDCSTLKLRLTLLMQGPPMPLRTGGHIILGAGILAALIMPHIQGFGLLERFHVEVERQLHSLPF